jgi:hypothetical protein
MSSGTQAIKVALATVLAVLVTACATPTATVPDKEADLPCPEWTRGQLRLTVSSAPIAVPPALTVSEGAVAGCGLQARRITIDVKPPQAASGMRLSASSLSIHIFGMAGSVEFGDGAFHGGRELCGVGGTFPERLLLGG